MESKEFNLESLLNKKDVIDNKELLSFDNSMQGIKKNSLSFSKDELEKIENIKKDINIVDSSDILQYGDVVQKDIANFSDNVLSNVKNKDSGEVGKILVELIDTIKEYDSSNSKTQLLRKIPIIGTFVGKTERLIAQYSSVSSQIENISLELDNNRMEMLKDIELFDMMYDKNIEYFKNLAMYIQAGEEKLLELENDVLPRLKQEASKSKNPMSVQVVNDFENAIDRFSKRIYDLKCSKTIAIQTAPQIRLIQNNNKMLCSKIQNAVYNTIPLWKNQTVIAIGLKRQEKVLSIQRAVTDMTNNLLSKNAELLHQNSVMTTRENERGIIDIQTLKKVNEELISTIKETIKVQQESRNSRLQAEKEIINIENQLKQVLLSNIDSQ